MKTPYRDGIIDVRLSKPETGIVTKATDLMVTLSKMQPINRNLAQAATAAADALAHVLKIAGCDAEERLPLIDGVPEVNTKAE